MDYLYYLIIDYVEFNINWRLKKMSKILESIFDFIADHFGVEGVVIIGPIIIILIILLYRWFNNNGGYKETSNKKFLFDKTEKNEGLIYTSRDELFFKIIVIGDPAVNKTRLLNNILSKRFEEKYIPTVGVNILKERLTISDEKGRDVIVNLSFWDIAGYPQFYMLHRPYFNGSDGAIAMYDFTKPITLNRIPEWIRKVRRLAGDIPILLVGKKPDLENRVISKEEAMKIKEEFKLSGFYEISAKTGKIILNMFEELAKLILRSKELVHKPTPKSSKIPAPNFPIPKKQTKINKNAQLKERITSLKLRLNSMPLDKKEEKPELNSMPLDKKEEKPELISYTCKFCGNKLTNEAIICPQCGTKIRNFTNF